jgi:hypothetical protein
VTLAVALGVALFAAPFVAFRAGYGWPSELRDRMLLGLALLGAAVMALAVEPGLGLLFGLAVWHWTSRYQLPGVLVLAVACLLYTAIKYGPPPVEFTVRYAIVATAVVQALWGACQHVRARREHWPVDRMRECVHGSTGNRVVLATLCAMALPLAPPLVMPALLLGLFVSISYVGIIAAGVGLALVYPTAWPLALAFALAIPWVVYWRGRPSDSWSSRALVWELSLRTLWAQRSWTTRLLGFGHGALRARGKWWCARAQTAQHFRDAHNDVVQVTFEYGLLGLAAVLLWAASVARGVALEDPLTGALAAGVISALGQFPSYLPQVSLAMLAVAALIARRSVCC